MSSKGIKTVIAELKKIGLSDHAIAGVLGNLEAESGWRPGVVNGSGHTGLAQWDNARFSRLKAMAAKNGWGSPTGWKAQAKYLAYEIKSGSGGTSVKELNGTGNAADAARVFENKFERSGGSNIPGRVSAAQKFAGSKILKSGTTGETPVPKVKGSSGGEMTWVPKVGDDVSNPFGAPGDYAAGKHTGSDIPGGTGGQPIRWAPPMSGKVVKVGSSGAYGNHVIIEDEKGRQWLLAHMQDGVKVSKGDRVDQGTMIGRVGNTGNSKGAHLHIEMTAPGEKWSYGNVKKPKLVFKVGANGQTYDKDFKPVSGDYLDAVGLSGQALSRQGNEELNQLVKQAVEKKWTSQEFTRRFRKTQWYIDRAGSQREFDMLQDTDQQQKVKQATAQARQVASGMGVELNDKQLRTLAVRIARDGYNDQQIQWFIGKRYSGEGDQAGAALSTQEALKEKAREYGIRLDPTVLKKWTKDVLQNGTPVDSFDDDIAGYAAQQNPYLKDAYDRGLTTREALQSYINSAAELIGVTEDEIDLSDSKWREVFDVNGMQLSDQQWRRKVKSDERYGYGNTTNAVNEARMHGRNLLRTMGVFSNG